LLSAALGFVAFGPAAFALTFTGNATVDFSSVSYAQVLDAANDVGLAFNAPPGTVSGWDVASVLFHLDLTAGELNVGLEYFGIAGDADGDGGEGTTSLWLAANDGLDLPGLAESESICVAFDFDQNGIYDLVAGVGENDGVYRVSVYTGSQSRPYRAFGPLLPAQMGPWFYAGTLAAPDVEFTLTNITPLLTLVGNTTCFNFRAFSGSFDDDGIGEDNVIGTVCLTDDGNVEAVQPAGVDLLSAFPNPFNPGTTLALDLSQTGPARVEVYNLKGERVATLADGIFEAGRHELAFNGAGLSSGVYLARLSTERGEQTSRLLLTK
jgi:hypothetical protein